MMTNEQFNSFITNLKLLNAKERDHLMRFAYLGQNNNYDETEKFLSPQFTKQLLEIDSLNLGLTKNAKCVFAGMDYHLDWLYVALKLAIMYPGYKISGTLPAGAPKDIFEMEPAPPGDTLYCDFRALMGNQEDIDLIAVFKDKSKYAILFIEAKGRAAFNKVQLARKLIRLDHILKKSGVVIKDAAPLINYRLILAAPEEPGFIEDSRYKSCRAFAYDLPKSKLGEPDKYELMRNALISAENHLSEIGEGLHYLQTPFPETTFAIERESKDSGHFTKWKFSERKGGLKKNDA